jgi:hypothetical protein
MRKMVAKHRAKKRAIRTKERFCAKVQPGHDRVPGTKRFIHGEVSSGVNCPGMARTIFLAGRMETSKGALLKG